LRFSATTEAEWDLFQAAVSEYECVPVTPQARPRDVVQKALAGHGTKAANRSIIIAAQTERLRLTVLHYDKDFEFMASITEQPQRMDRASWHHRLRITVEASGRLPAHAAEVRCRTESTVVASREPSRWFQRDSGEVLLVLDYSKRQGRARQDE
jgi:hypothetical protein